MCVCVCMCVCMCVCVRVCVCVCVCMCINYQLLGIQSVSGFGLCSSIRGRPRPDFILHSCEITRARKAWI